MDVAQLRELVGERIAEMEAALHAIENPQPGADETALQTVFDAARDAHTTATRKLENAEAVLEARRALPVDVNDHGADVPRLDDEPRSVPDAPGHSRRETDGLEFQHEARVVKTPAVYRMGGHDSFMLDQLKAQKGSRDAIQRLTENARELHEQGRVSEPELRAIAETAGAGGELVAPLYLQEEYLRLARAARPYWDILTKRPLPPNANTINIPRLKTGTSTAAQKDLGNVEATDLTTGLLTFPVITVAGDQDFARQLFDRAVPELADMVVFPDLVADYFTKTDIQAISGNGTAPNARGVLNTREITETIKPHTITYTAGEFKLSKLYSKIAGAVAAIHETRFMPPTAIIMHPRRWAACLASVDAQERPLIVPAASGPFNVIGNLEQVAPEAIVGHMQGLPVIVDPSIPINLGAGTNQDVIIVQRSEDIWALEDEPIKTKTYEEVLSKELAIRCQVFNYLAVTTERYPQSIALIEGTGLSTPAF